MRDLSRARACYLSHWSVTLPPDEQWLSTFPALLTSILSFLSLGCGTLATTLTYTQSYLSTLRRLLRELCLLPPNLRCAALHNRARRPEAWIIDAAWYGKAELQSLLTLPLLSVTAFFVRYTCPHPHRGVGKSHCDNPLSSPVLTIRLSCFLEAVFL